jgi:general secretion pathway protein D
MNSFLPRPAYSLSSIHSQSGHFQVPITPMSQTPQQTKRLRRKSTLILCAWIVLPLLNLTPSADAGAGVLGVGVDEMAADGITGVAAREIARRQAMIQEARDLVLEGDRAYARGDLEDAIELYGDALNTIPTAAATEAIRAEIVDRYVTALVALARRSAEEGRYAQARQLLDTALLPNVDPTNAAALRLLAQLDDTERFEPARTGEHTDNVEEVIRLLRLGESYYLLGDYDNAEKQFYEVLNIDRTNTAARRFLERVEQTRMEYYGAAYRHTRERMLRQVAQAWELQAPREIQPDAIE